MPKIHEIFTPANLSGYYNESQAGVDADLGERLFPTSKQLGLKLSFIKGASGRPVILRPSAFDTKVTLRERLAVELMDAEMPFFKEGMLIKEVDRQQLNTVAMTNNAELLNTIVKTIFDDKTNLITGAQAVLEVMRMEVLATGKIAINANGVAKDYDYQVPDANKGTVTVGWSGATADPLADIEAAVAELEELGEMAEAVIMNAKTFGQLKNAPKTVARINPIAAEGATLTKQAVIDYLETEFGLRVEIKNGVYTDHDGNAKKYYPDEHVTLIPNITLGQTVFGTTPEESDLISGNNVNVEAVNTGIAVTTENMTDPVNVQTKVSMIALPSFTQIDRVYMLTTEPEDAGV